MSIKVQVKDLRKGDDLGTCKIVQDPAYLGTFCGQKDRMLVGVQFGDKEPEIRRWGKYTTVTVTNR
jgi:hypothetical protein